MCATCLSGTKKGLGLWVLGLQPCFKERASLQMRNPQIMSAGAWVKTGDHVEEHENSEPGVGMDAFLF